ncbi:MAG: hypothetical protein KF752_17295 [Pirellulaceae bacterium]|nr:hypothetical protein [Pirellulaceae bacterium]
MERLRALQLLAECTGDDIWSLEYCRQKRIPDSWIERLSDCFESGFERDSQTIYVGDHVTNQYLGIRDVDLAIELARVLGLNIDRLTTGALSRRALVLALQEAIEEGQ